ncbi:hypothetical protein Trydic_g18153 [Trypoxylus dichotomus]
MPFLKGKSILESRCRNLENSSKKNGLRHAVFAPPKDKYVGQWRDNIKSGKGYLLSRSGQLYEGDWERGYRHGFGVLGVKNDKDVVLLLYKGEWKNGRMHGIGARHYPDGSYYLGNWKNSKRHGYGQMWYANGSFYDGFWVKDKKEGWGMFVRPDGNRYEGSWKEDHKDGRGRFFHLDSGQLQSGIWKRDVCCFSSIFDIPFRQNAVEGTPYPVQCVELEKPEELCQRRDLDISLGKFYSCASLRVWV